MNRKMRAKLANAEARQRKERSAPKTCPGCGSEVKEEVVAKATVELVKVTHPVPKEKLN